MRLKRRQINESKGIARYWSLHLVYTSPVDGEDGRNSFNHWHKHITVRFMAELTRDCSA